MRPLIVAVFAAFFAISLVSARDEPLEKEEKFVFSHLAAAQIDPDTDPRLFLKEYRLDPDADSLNVRSWRGEKWFKRTVVFYSFGAAVKSYLEHDGYKLKRISHEPTVSTSFATNHGTRVMLAPRSIPQILFLERGSFERVWAIHVISGGVAVTCAFTPGRPKTSPR